MSTKRDNKFAILKRLVEKGEITHFNEIYNVVDPTPIYRALGVSWDRWKRMEFKPQYFEVSELLHLASMFGINEDKFLAIAMAQIKLDRELAKKGKTKPKGKK